ncbi:DsbE family thiol:disulfide interchange protein [Pseudorhodoferax sp.]|uniref:DsbE family thiol:disulfide interchange protein n=1 Tax=Pseudorhodoferax sp. TaxID=1993553 RepID=UPI002DD62518|nr:DsbE family thiol:disulfide interchange protein [Pseudorhodoferax sp.]
MKPRHFVPLALFVGLAVLLGVGLTLNPREVPSPFVGKPAPAFQLGQLDASKPPFEPAQMKGQVWLLNVFASWCAPCRDEHPLLVAAARNQVVPLVGLNYKDKQADADDWLRKLGNPYQVVAVDRDGRVAIDYGVYGVPETFVIDRAGIVRLKHIGPLTLDDWQRKVLPLIRELQQ